MLSDTPEFETIVESLEYIPYELRQHVRIVICGRGERLPWLQEVAKRYPQFVVPGYVDGVAIASLMDHATVGLLAYPSRGDLSMSYPNKIGEYLAGHLPVISTLTGASADLLTSRDCGIVVPNRNAKAFAEALVSLTTDKARLTRMKHNAASTFIEMFSAQENYARMAGFLRSLAGPGEDATYRV
jgi:glycosyltransferase involved in cell wall biosynthesis